MLYLIGLGLDEDDISLKAINAVKTCEKIYYEFFTSVWKGHIKNIENVVGKPAIELKREQVESDLLIKEAAERNIALLIPGDPLTATTHFELFLESKKQGIEVFVIHSTSIYTAIAETGLHIYKFGRATTLPRPQQNFNPTSPLDIVKENKKFGFHTLILLDIGMTAQEGLNILSKEFENYRMLACCNLGTPSKIIKYGSMYSLAKEEQLNKTPAVLIMPGTLNFKEEEALELWR